MINKKRKFYDKFDSLVDTSTKPMSGIFANLFKKGVLPKTAEYYRVRGLSEEDIPVFREMIIIKYLSKILRF
ncbi:hypothetical protein Hs30E_01950 [Lactococcus hodotermopsidis]|uniref:Uncharacterized protein n=1 Tax=Pseudolactococcus hodotermopsidis TaxID=2709157 RepID=A0A6A0BB95_9LACT|nr:hypothetical protein [Lactococcus hodotermopsidis]GFH41644.1 hypothetical protein Hs30E_01950 [Lactococcus hodotermopsidis]